MSHSARASFATGIGNRVFYGWIMVAVAALGLFASGPGQSHTFGVFYERIAADLGVTRTDVAWAYGLATTAAAFLLPFMGRQVDHFGARKSLMGIVIGLGVACFFFGSVGILFASAFMNMVWLVLAFGFLRFLGQGSMMLGSANLVAHWFTKKRGFAMSLMALGFAASIAVHPKLGQYLMLEFGWRTAWYILGVMTWILMLPVLFLVVFDKPSMLDMHPDNERPAPGSTAPELTGPTVAEAIRHRSFYLICMAWFGFSALVTSLHFHQVAILKGQGIDPEWATSSFVITACSMVVFMPLVGRGCDRFRTRYMLAAGLVVQSLALVLITFATTVPMLFVYAICFGLNNAFTMTLFGYLWPRYFGRKHLGRIQGTGQMVAVIGASVGPIPVSLAFDMWNDPAPMLLVTAIYPIVVAVIAVIFLATHPAVEGTEHLE